MKYYIIGGQYKPHCYGYSDTLRGAKAMASRNKEYWDNFQGWRTPRIYTEDAVQKIESIIVPEGVCSWYHDGKAWIDNTRPQW